jgi:hypothetical protein
LTEATPEQRAAALLRMRDSESVTLAAQPYLNINFSRSTGSAALLEKGDSHFVLNTTSVNSWARVDCYTNSATAGCSYALNTAPWDVAQFSLVPVEVPANRLLAPVDNPDRELGAQANFDSERWTVRATTWSRDADRRVAELPDNLEAPHPPPTASRANPGKTNKRKEPVDNVEVVVPVKKQRKQ